MSCGEPAEWRIDGGFCGGFEGGLWGRDGVNACVVVVGREYVYVYFVDIEGYVGAAKDKGVFLGFWDVLDMG